jgi:tetratricopeptide (TPR) repeat protein
VDLFRFFKGKPVSPPPSGAAAAESPASVPPSVASVPETSAEPELAGEEQEAPEVFRRLTAAGQGEVCEHFRRGRRLLKGEGGSTAGGTQSRSAEEAVAVFQALVERCDTWLQNNSTLRPEYRALLALSACNLGNALRTLRRFAEAAPHHWRAVSVCAQLAQQGQSDLRPLLPGVENELGLTLVNVGKTEEAAEQFGQAVAHWQELIEEGQGQWQLDLGKALMNHGLALATVGRVEEGIAGLRRAIALHERLVGEGKTSPPRDARVELARTRANLGAMLRGGGQRDEAVKELRVAVDLFERLVSEGREDLRQPAHLARNLLQVIVSGPPVGEAGRATSLGAAPFQKLFEGLDNSRMIELLQELPGEFRQEMMQYFSGRQTPLAGIALARMGLALGSLDPGRRDLALQCCRIVLEQMEPHAAGDDRLRAHLSELRTRLEAVQQS